MSAKEIKSHLKASKQAIDKQDFQAALEHCRDIFRADEKHYTGLVFAGLASLKLGEYEESRGYYRRALSVQPEGPLAWKGFADFFDRRKPVVKEEQLEAIDVYTKLLSFVENDVEKLRSTYQKLASLHKEFNHQDQVVRCYSAAVMTYDPGDLSDSEASSCSALWMDFSAYIVGREGIPEGCLEMLHQGFLRIHENEEKQTLREKLVKKLYARYLASGVCDADLKVFLEEECTHLVQTAPLTALPILLHLLLTETLPSSPSCLTERPVTVSEQQREWVGLMSSFAATSLKNEGSEGGASLPPWDESLRRAGQALVSMADGKWSEARDAINRSVGCSAVKCECWCWCSLLHLHLHDYKTAVSAAENGLTTLSSAAKFRVPELERNLKLWRCESYIGSENAKLTSQAVPFLTELVQEAHENHVTALLVKSHLLLADASSAQSVLDRVGEEARDAGLLALQGEVYLAQGEYKKALSRLESWLLLHPNSPALLLVKARVLWTDTEQEKAKAYSALLQAAKADPMNPEVFLYLGHYQKLITRDLKRAEKCYQKAVSLQPSHPEAAVSLGDILWMNGEEEKAYDIYWAVTAAALPSRTKVAWIRMGLYQKSKKQYNEAIKSFQTILSSFPEDKHCWECLGEAYLARGSHNSALRTFTKCIQLDPDSIQCHYQMASIKQQLGLLQESLVDYSSVLERDPGFVPALKGSRPGIINNLTTSFLRSWEPGHLMCRVSKQQHTG